MGVPTEPLAIAVMALIAGLVSLHVPGQKEIRLAVVHGMAAQAAQLALAARVACRARQALMPTRRGQCRAVAPEATVDPARLLHRFIRRRNGAGHCRRVLPSTLAVKLHLL